MNTWINHSGKPLSDPKWLYEHHEAKITEREKFAQTLATYKPKNVVDLGCGTGLWLEILDQTFDEGVKFIGLDGDEESIRLACDRAKSWNRDTKFETLNFEGGTDLPSADLYLAFNIFPYIKDLSGLLGRIKEALNPGGKLVVRQYDGFDLNFGPMETTDKLTLMNSLFAAIGQSRQFSHFSRDDIFKELNDSDFKSKKFSFEMLHKVSPYNPKFKRYLINTIDWTSLYVNEKSKGILRQWKKEYLQENAKPSYFKEAYLVAELS